MKVSREPESSCIKALTQRATDSATFQALSSFDTLAFAHGSTMLTTLSLSKGDHELAEWQRAAVEPLDPVFSKTWLRNFRLRPSDFAVTSCGACDLPAGRLPPSHKASEDKLLARHSLGDGGRTSALN